MKIAVTFKHISIPDLFPPVTRMLAHVPRVGETLRLSTGEPEIRRLFVERIERNLEDPHSESVTILVRLA